MAAPAAHRRSHRDQPLRIARRECPGERECEATRCSYRKRDHAHCCARRRACSRRAHRSARSARSAGRATRHAFSASRLLACAHTRDACCAAAARCAAASSDESARASTTRRPVARTRALSASSCHASSARVSERLRTRAMRLRRAAPDGAAAAAHRMVNSASSMRPRRDGRTASTPPYSSRSRFAFALSDWSARNSSR